MEKKLKFGSYKTKITRSADGWCPMCQEIKCICPRGSGVFYTPTSSLQYKFNSVGYRISVHTASQEGTIGHKVEE